MAFDAERMIKAIDELLESQPDDQRLRDHLIGLIDRRAVTFPSLTWYWGPKLYERNRVVFRTIIINHFSDWAQENRHRWKHISWETHAEVLEPWLAKARKNRDTTLVRRLLRWKFSSGSWRVNSKKWCAALLDDYAAASGPAARAITLDEYDDWFQLTESSAIQLYRIDSNARSFITKHLPASGWGGEKRGLWSELSQIASEASDDAFRLELYRKLVPVKRWKADILRLAEHEQDNDKLDEALESCHPEGWGLDRSAGLLALLKARGRDVMPYVMRHLAESVGGWHGSGSKKFIELAAVEGWWDLWAASIRASRDAKPLNKAVTKLLSETSPNAKQTVLRRLNALAGVSREWNFAGFGFARIHSLDDAVAVQLYNRFPELIHGPYKAHVLPRWWMGYPGLLDAAQNKNDEELIDLLASRYATRIRYENPWGPPPRKDAVMKTADALGEYYESIRAKDEVAFAERAANVLTRIPSYSIFSYRQLLRSNRLARLLFVRSFNSLLASERAVQDLVEGSDIHVQMLAYRVLSQNDQRARRMALDNLELLIATLLRPLHRKTRIPAFDALANAASIDKDAAERVLSRCRDALSLPDKKYPKEQLIGLIGRILAVHPGLRRPQEQPKIYGLEPVESEVAS